MSRMSSRRMLFPQGQTPEQLAQQEKEFAFDELEASAKTFAQMFIMAGLKETNEKPEPNASIAKRAFDLAEAFEAETNARAETRGIK